MTYELSLILAQISDALVLCPPQLLWVNLIMDTMGALALATEPPSLDLLKQKPNGHEAPLITRCMWKHILVQGLYQVRAVLYSLSQCVSRT